MAQRQAPLRIFKHLTWVPSREKWKAAVPAKVRRHKYKTLHLGYFPRGRQRAAAEKVCAHLKLPSVESLRIKTAQPDSFKVWKGHGPPEKRTHQFATWSCSHRQWQASVPYQGQKRYLGAFRLQANAVAAAFKFLLWRMPRQYPTKASFSLKVVRKRDDPGKGCRGLVELRKDMFRALVKPYLRQGCKRQRVQMPLLPGDAEDCNDRAQGKKARLLDDEGLGLPALLTKYGPDRDALDDAFCAANKRKRSGTVKAELDYAILVDGLRRMSKVPAKARAPWLRGPGHHTSHHGGLVPYAHRSLGILASRKKGTRAHGMKLGQMKRVYVVRPFSATIRKKLELVRGYGKKCRALKPAHDLKSYASNFQVLAEACKGVPGISNPKKYRAKWCGQGH